MGSATHFKQVRTPGAARPMRLVMPPDFRCGSQASNSRYRGKKKKKRPPGTRGPSCISPENTMPAAGEQK